jgi:hypothetical protein
MENSAAIGALASAFKDIAPRPPLRPYEDLALLQPLVFAVVDEMKASGELPERVLSAIRALAISAGIGPGDVLVQQLMRWCVERYFPNELPA